MADIRIKDLATTASVTASDDFMAVDGVTNGTRKLSAATPSFATSVTTPSLTSPASTNLTLGLGTGGTALTLASSTLVATFAGAVSVINALTTANSLRVGNAGSNVYLAAENNTGGSFVVGSTANAGLLVSQNPLQISVDNGSSVQATISSTGLALTGAATISSTTAGSSGAGALVVQGGISAGAASYFGGTVRASSVGALGKANDVVTGGSANDFGIGTYGTATNIIFATGTGYLERARISDTGLAVTGALSTTGAATFAGAVTIGNTVNSVSPTSPNRTVTMVVNGVTLYLAAKTTND